jgi:hyperosmotically inducible periplasmic protein
MEFGKKALGSAVLAVLIAGSIAACTRRDRDTAEKQVATATEEAKTQARELGDAAADTARQAGEEARAAAASAGDAVADALLELKVKAALLDQIGVDGARLSVDADDGHVSLAGSVNSKSTADLAAKVAGSVEGVHGVDSRIAIENDTAGALIDKQVDRALGAAQGTVADAMLETRVKTRLIEEMGKAAFAVEVEAAGGTVSLSGSVPDDIRRALAVQTAQRTQGVTKVTDSLRIGA